MYSYHTQTYWEWTLCYRGGECQMCLALSTCTECTCSDGDYQVAEKWLRRRPIEIKQVLTKECMIGFKLAYEHAPISKDGAR